MWLKTIASQSRQTVAGFSQTHLNGKPGVKTAAEDLGCSITPSSPLHGAMKCTIVIEVKYRTKHTTVRDFLFLAIRSDISVLLNPSRNSEWI